MKYLTSLLLIVLILSSGTVSAKYKMRKPSSENAVDCRISSETKGGYTGYFLLLAGEREDDGVWMNKISIMERLANFQIQGICKDDKKVIPVNCKVESEKVMDNYTLSYVSVEGASKNDSGSWSVESDATKYLDDLKKKGVCKE